MGKSLVFTPLDDDKNCEQSCQRSQTNQLKLSEILKTIEKIGYHALPFQPDQHEALYQKQNKVEVNFSCQ